MQRILLIFKQLKYVTYNGQKIDEIMGKKRNQIVIQYASMNSVYNIIKGKQKITNRRPNNIYLMLLQHLYGAIS